MPPKSNPNKWNDVQIAIATTAIVTTLGLWNLFAEPSKTVTAQVDQPVLPPPPTEQPSTDASVVMPQVKIMFTQTAPQASTVVQPQKVKKKKNNNGGGGGTVTKTKTS